MKPLRKREFPMYYSKGKKLIQIIVHLSDAPGSLSKILDILRPKVNFIGTGTYTLGDGTAMLSAFAELLSKDETPESLQKLLGSTPATIESEVLPGEDGLLVDTFHSGLEVGNDLSMLVSRAGLTGVFDHIVKTFGTGGEVLLYEEGAALARENAERTEKALAPGMMREHASYLTASLTAQGWGVFRREVGKGQNELTITVTDCFECTRGSDIRKRCNFIRGYLESAGTFTRGTPMLFEETECTLRGGRACVFRMSPRKRSRMTD